MCYKEEKQRKNKEKLEKKFLEDNTPDFIRLYFVKFARKSQASTLIYYPVIKNFLEWCIKKEYIKKSNFSEIIPSDLNEIIPIQIQQYLAEREENISNATMFHNACVLKSFWEYLVDCEYTKRNIVKTKELHKENSEENLSKKLPTKEQINQMIDRIRESGKSKGRYQKTEAPLLSKRNEYVVRVLIGSGIRESELAGLDICDVYLSGKNEEERPFIKVLGKRHYNPETEQRKVLLSTDAVQAIKEWLVIRAKMENIKDDKSLFINTKGKRLNEDNIRGIFTRYGNGITPHMCRHYCATALSQKYGISVAQQQCGHVSVGTTMGHYVNALANLTEIIIDI